MRLPKRWSTLPFLALALIASGCGPSPGQKISARECASMRESNNMETRQLEQAKAEMDKAEREIAQARSNPAKYGTDLAGVRQAEETLKKHRQEYDKVQAELRRAIAEMLRDCGR